MIDILEFKNLKNMSWREFSEKLTISRPTFDALESRKRNVLSSKILLIKELFEELSAKKNKNSIILSKSSTKDVNDHLSFGSVSYNQNIGNPF